MDDLTDLIAFLERRESGRREQHFLRRRRAEILTAVAEAPAIWLTSIPQDFSGEEFIDIHDDFVRRLMSNPPGDGLAHGVACGRPRPTLEGLEASQSAYWEVPTPSSARLVLFRNGFVDFVKPLGQRADNFYFASRVDTEYIASFILFAGALYQHLSTRSAINIRFSVLNARGMWLAVSDHQDHKVVWSQKHLELGPFSLSDLGSDARPVIRQVCDRLWNAFHYEQANVFDAEGNLT